MSFSPAWLRTAERIFNLDVYDLTLETFEIPSIFFLSVY